MPIIPLTSNDFIINGNLIGLKKQGISVCFFKSSRCQSSRSIENNIVQLSRKYSNVIFGMCDVNQCSEIIKSSKRTQTSITKTPTFLFFINSQVVSVYIGTDINKIDGIISNALQQFMNARQSKVINGGIPNTYQPIQGNRNFNNVKVEQGASTTEESIPYNEPWKIMV